MTRAFIIKQPGDVNVLKLDNIKDPVPGDFEVLIAHKAIGVNSFDVCYRKGIYKLDVLPAVLGMSGCGYIEAIGAKVREFKVGDRVAYATGPMGAYAEKRIIHQRYLVAVPPELSDVQVAGSLVNGLLVHALVFRVVQAAKTGKVMVHSAAGGVGQILCQWLKYIGCEITGTVGSSEKVEEAMKNGCTNVIDRSQEDIFEATRRITNDEGFEIVYDGIGQYTVTESMRCLGPFGVCVNYGDISGVPRDFNVDYISVNSLYYTRPRLGAYKANRMELVLGANEVFEHLKKGMLRPTINTYAFEGLPQAHMDLESGKTMGSCVVKF